MSRVRSLSLQFILSVVDDVASSVDVLGVVGKGGGQLLVHCHHPSLASAPPHLVKGGPLTAESRDPSQADLLPRSSGNSV